MLITYDHVVLARNLALQYHGDQQYDGHNYVFHLDQVASIIIEFYGESSFTLQVLAYLHDILEDTDISTDKLTELFGDYIAACVLLVTDCQANNRKERKKLTNAKLKAASLDYFDALRTKVADRLANMRNSLRTRNEKLFSMYLAEYAEFKEAVSREGLDEALWEELDQLVNSHRAY